MAPVATHFSTSQRGSVNGGLLDNFRFDSTAAGCVNSSGGGGPPYSPSTVSTVRICACADRSSASEHDDDEDQDGNLMIEQRPRSYRNNRSRQDSDRLVPPQQDTDGGNSDSNVDNERSPQHVTKKPNNERPHSTPLTGWMKSNRRSTSLAASSVGSSGSAKSRDRPPRRRRRRKSEHHLPAEDAEAMQQQQQQQRSSPIQKSGNVLSNLSKHLGKAVDNVKHATASAVSTVSSSDNNNRSNAYTSLNSVTKKKKDKKKKKKTKSSSSSVGNTKHKKNKKKQSEKKDNHSTYYTSGSRSLSAISYNHKDENDAQHTTTTTASPLNLPSKQPTATHMPKGTSSSAPNGSPIGADRAISNNRNSNKITRQPLPIIQLGDDDDNNNISSGSSSSDSNEHHKGSIKASLSTTPGSTNDNPLPKQPTNIVHRQQPAVQRYKRPTEPLQTTAIPDDEETTTVTTTIGQTKDGKRIVRKIVKKKVIRKVKKKKQRSLSDESTTRSEQLIAYGDEVESTHTKATVATQPTSNGPIKLGGLRIPTPFDSTHDSEASNSHAVPVKRLPLKPPLPPSWQNGATLPAAKAVPDVQGGGTRNTKGSLKSALGTTVKKRVIRKKGKKKKKSTLATGSNHTQDTSLYSSTSSFVLEEEAEHLSTSFHSPTATNAKKSITDAIIQSPTTPTKTNVASAITTGAASNASDSVAMEKSTVDAIDEATKRTPKAGTSRKIKALARDFHAQQRRNSASGRRRDNSPGPHAKPRATTEDTLTDTTASMQANRASVAIEQAVVAPMAVPKHPPRAPQPQSRRRMQPQRPMPGTFKPRRHGSVGLPQKSSSAHGPLSASDRMGDSHLAVKLGSSAPKQTSSQSVGFAGKHRPRQPESPNPLLQHLSESLGIDLQKRRRHPLLSPELATSTATSHRCPRQAEQAELASVPPPPPISPSPNGLTPKASSCQKMSARRNSGDEGLRQLRSPQQEQQCFPPDNTEHSLSSDHAPKDRPAIVVEESEVRRSVPATSERVQQNETNHSDSTEQSMTMNDLGQVGTLLGQSGQTPGDKALMASTATLTMSNVSSDQSGSLSSLPLGIEERPSIDTINAGDVATSNTVTAMTEEQMLSSLSVTDTANDESIPVDISYLIRHMQVVQNLDDLAQSTFNPTLISDRMLPVSHQRLLVRWGITASIVDDDMEAIQKFQYQYGLSQDDVECIREHFRLVEQCSTASICWDLIFQIVLPEIGMVQELNTNIIDPVDNLVAMALEAATDESIASGENSLEYRSQHLHKMMHNLNKSMHSKYSLLSHSFDYDDIMDDEDDNQSRQESVGTFGADTFVSTLGPDLVEMGLDGAYNEEEENQRLDLGRKLRNGMSFYDSKNRERELELMEDMFEIVQDWYFIRDGDELSLQDLYGIISHLQLCEETGQDIKWDVIDNILQGFRDQYGESESESGSGDSENEGYDMEDSESEYLNDEDGSVEEIEYVDDSGNVIAGT